MTPKREDIIKLREGGMTREQIAAHYNVSTTTVRRWIKTLNIPRPSRNARDKRGKHLTKSGEIIAPVDDGFTVLDRAKLLLGPRLVEKRWAGYFLDGTPVGVDKIIAAYEQVKNKTTSS